MNRLWIGIACREIFATEIIRIMIGNISLVMAVPITTLIAAWMLVKTAKAGTSTPEEIRREEKALDEFKHNH
ncbi:MAG: YibE/F family protein [bacterium]|nr:YibE/F family protein [bacterium]